MGPLSEWLSTIKTWMDNNPNDGVFLVPGPEYFVYLIRVLGVAYTNYYLS